MASKLDFDYSGYRRDIEALGYRRIIKESIPPSLPTHSREACMSQTMLYGQTGSGKTIGGIYFSLEKYHLHIPQFGIKGFKVFGIDIYGKGELCCTFQPIDDSHPLYGVCQEIGLKPESYPVQVLRPLVYIREKPDLRYQQPSIVRPFTLALSELTLQEWNCLLPNGLSPGQLNLHDTTLKECHETLETTTMYDLFVKAQEIIERGDVGYGSHIKGMEKTDTIPLSRKIFSGREAQGLLQKYQAITDTGLIQPEKYKGKLVSTNLNLKKILSNQKTITVLYAPDYQDLPHLNIGIVNYLLNHILHLKNPNNPSRVTTPICLHIPELKGLCPKHIPEKKRYFIEPVKNTLLNLVSMGAGVGISITGDTQFFESIPDEYRANVTTTFIYSLGEESGEKIKELVKNRYVSNFKEITDNYHLSALNNIGTFIYLGHGSTRAEIRRNAIVSFFYPRTRGKATETETNWYDLFRRFHPKKMKDIGSLYGLILQINMDAQSRASVRMCEILAETEQKKRKQTPEEKRLEVELKVLKALSKVCEEKTYFEYAEITEKLVPLLHKSDVQVRRYLKQLGEGGYLIIDATQGRKRKKVTVDREKVEKALKETEEAK